VGVWVIAVSHPQKSYDDLGDRLPALGRAGQVSGAGRYRLVPGAFPYITGQVLHVDSAQIAGY
jgi:hypothetical protein